MDSINRDILRLSLPTIVSNITVPLLGICDTAISGHLGSELFLSAIAVGTVMLNVVFWIFGFLRGGTTGLTANALGSGNEEEISKVFYRSLLIALVAGFLIILCHTPVFKILWWITGSDSEIKNFVIDYFNIRVWGAPALLATMAISGWFVGMQTTFYPMLIAILMNIVNIGSSFWFVYGLGYGFNGVAMGTTISNWIGLIVAAGCIIWFRNGKGLRCTYKNLIEGNWWRYFSVNGNLFLRSFFIICVTMGVTAAGARISNLTLAVNAVVMQFFLFFSFFMDGIAFSGEALAGLRCGEKNFSLLDMTVKKLLHWTIATALTFSFLYLLALKPVTSLLTDNVRVIEEVFELNYWIILIPVVSCWAFIFDGLYIGITDTFKMMLSALIGGILFFGVVSLNYYEISYFRGIEGNKVIWTAFLCYLGGRGAFLSLTWKNSILRLKNLTQFG